MIFLPSDIFLVHDNKELLTPSWPTNIQITSTNNAIGEAKVVIPIVNPTVPNAEDTSYKQFKKSNWGKEPILMSEFSIVGVYKIIITDKNINNKATKNTTNELITMFLGMFRFKIDTFVLPLIIEMIVANITTNVVVLIPPAVEDGDAPINIITI